VRDDFKPDYKVTTAQRLCQQADADCQVTLANFQVILREALIFLEIETVPEAEV